jgi:hypothetical protein
MQGGRVENFSPAQNGLFTLGVLRGDQQVGLRLEAGPVLAGRDAVVEDVEKRIALDAVGSELWRVGDVIRSGFMVKFQSKSKILWASPIAEQQRAVVTGAACRLRGGPDADT